MSTDMGFARSPRPARPRAAPRTLRRGTNHLAARMSGRDRIIGIVLGIILGIAIVAIFVFVFSEDTVDAPSIHNGAPTEAPAQP
jgi:hypothetical protein